MSGRGRGRIAARGRGGKNNNSSRFGKLIEL